MRRFCRHAITVIFFMYMLSSMPHACSACSCDLENKMAFLRLRQTVNEHAVPTQFRIDTTPVCPAYCLIFNQQPEDAEQMLPQGNWSISRNGQIDFQHWPHKTGLAELKIQIEEASISSDFIGNATFSIDIREDPDAPFVFAEQRGIALTLVNFNNASDSQHRNLSLTVEQNTANNSAYADLQFTAGAFDYDDKERIVVHIEASDRPQLGVVSDLGISSSVQLLEPSDCSQLPNQRLLNRNISRWDSALTGLHACGLQIPYPANELSWFAHLCRYAPAIGRSGEDAFALTFTDKYSMKTKIFVRVSILQNPCVNGATCRGPAWDPSCKSANRSVGFFNLGYTCACEDGWVGDRCEIDFDDCFSSPCPAPFVCRDRFRGFDCVCPENYLNCESQLKPWQLASALLGSLAVATIVISALILFNLRAPLMIGANEDKRTVNAAIAAATSIEMVNCDTQTSASAQQQLKEEKEEQEEEEEEEEEEEAGVREVTAADAAESTRRKSNFTAQFNSVAAGRAQNDATMMVEDAFDDDEVTAMPRLQPAAQPRDLRRFSFSRSVQLLRPKNNPKLAFEMPVDEVDSSGDDGDGAAGEEPEGSGFNRQKNFDRNNFPPSQRGQKNRSVLFDF